MNYGVSSLGARRWIPQKSFGRGEARRDSAHIINHLKVPYVGGVLPLACAPTDQRHRVWGTPFDLLDFVITMQGRQPLLPTTIIPGGI